MTPTGRRLIVTVVVAAAATGCPRSTNPDGGPPVDPGRECNGCWDNGVCVPATSVQLCGPFCVDCRLVLARNTTTPACVNGACASIGCVDGWFDCDDSAGCETRCDVQSATGVTRGCGAACDYAACVPGFADCDGDRRNGCEASCSSVFNTTGAILTCAGGAPVCDYTACVPGFADCDGDRRNGCEASCSSVSNTTGAILTCVGGVPVCDYAACVASWFDCDGLRGNGCEFSCTPASATGVTLGCPGGSPGCDYGACLPTFLDCDGNRSNGCEFAATLEACPRLEHVAGVACGCDFTACSPGFFDCDGNRTNGCESPLSPCPALLARTGDGRSIAVDDVGVYWTTSGGVFTKPHTGGAVVTLASEPSALGLAVHGGEVFFTTWPYGSTGGKVMRVSRTGGQPTTVATGQAVNVAAGPAGIFWTLLDNLPTSSPGRVMTMPLAGGVASQLAGASAQPFALAVDSTAVYWTDLQPPPLVRRSAHSSGSLQDYSDSAGPGTADDVGASVAVASGHVYWASARAMNASTPARISRAPVDGGVGEVLARLTQLQPRSIATDGLDLYWVEVGMGGGRGAVRALPLDGGTERTLFFGDFGPSLAPFRPALGGQALTLDATTVYWVTNEGVYSLPR